jgi:hypothetical protein
MQRRNVLLIGFLVLGSTVLFSRDGLAGVSLSGFSFNWGSIDCSSILQALSKKDAPHTGVGCEAKVREVSLQCVNKGGNAGTSNAEKFQLTESAPISVQINASSCTPDKRVQGRWFCTESITDTQITNALLQEGGPIGSQCGPNPNFTFQLDVVTQMCAQVFITDANNNLADAGFAACDLAADSPAGTPFNCEEISAAAYADCSVNLFPIP